MAKYGREDVILHAISQTALGTLSEYVDINRIKGMLLTGSVANGEGTVVDFDSCLIASDFDFVIYLNSNDFLQKRRYLQDLSQEISKKLVKSGVNTHVTFLPHTNLLSLVAFLAKSSIYDYEFALASKSVFGRTPSFKKTARPEKKDALELAFTVVSDLVFLKYRHMSKLEESYILAKRALTLLNSALIFAGAPVETYEKRMKIAREFSPKWTIPISQNEIEILDRFTEYKLSGSLQNLMDRLGFKNVIDLVNFQIEFLRELTAKILFFELTNLDRKPLELKLLRNDSPQKISEKIPRLLKGYSSNSRTLLPSRIIGVILYVFGLLSRNKERKELFATFIFHKQSPKVILNVLVTLLFINRNDSSAVKIFGEVFSWINFNSSTVFSLWQASERSIKLS